MTRRLCYAVARKEVRSMPDELSKEYLLLFNAITDAVEQLIAAQQKAEQIFLERTE